MLAVHRYTELRTTSVFLLYRVVQKSKPIVFTVILKVIDKFPSNFSCNFRDEC